MIKELKVPCCFSNSKKKRRVMPKQTVNKTADTESPRLYCIGEDEYQNPCYVDIAPEENDKFVKEMVHGFISSQLVQRFEAGYEEINDFYMWHIKDCPDCETTYHKLFLNAH